MSIDILHINSNYIYTNLHQCMLEKLDKKSEINSRVFMATQPDSLGVVKPNSNVTVCECFKKWDKLVFDYKQYKICKALEHNINVKDFDLIHAYTLFTDGNCARKMSKKYGKPYVVAIRNTDVNDFFRLMPHLRGRGRKIMRDAKAVFFLSESYREQVFAKYVPKKYYEDLWSKTYVVPNGIDDFWFENPPTEENKLDSTVKLIFAGRIDRNKNIPTTQKAIKLLKDKGYDVSLTVVGKISDQKLFNEIKDDSDTTFVPPMPKEELIKLYREHNIFVMPSFTESFGLVYAEAMSQGLPVVYSKGQGYDNQFEEGAVGYRVDASNCEDVADGIEKVIKNFNNIKQNVVQLSKRFNWTDITAVYDKIYKEIK